MVHREEVGLVDPLVVYGSEDCPGWTELSDVLREFKRDSSVGTPVRIKDPLEYAEEFRARGLVVCPSILYRDELIVVGVPTLSELKEKTADPREGSTVSRT